MIDDLLGWTVVVGSRFFPEDVLRKVFDKELEMLKDWPEVQRWMQESKSDGARAVAESVLSRRFGELTEATRRYLHGRNAEELSDLAARAVSAPDLQSLGLPA